MSADDDALGAPRRDTPVWVHDVSKWFGPVLGVNRVSLRIDGGIVALVGPNGAGKSTLLKLLTGQLRPSIGAIRIFGRSVRSPFARRRLGYSPDVDAFYEEMTGREFVRAMLQLSGYSRREAFARADRALDAVGMADGADGLRAGKRIRGGSKGMRQRIKLAQAIAHDPDLLILDEPLSGLDPVGRRDFCRLFAEQAARGATVLVSSHVMAEVRELADRVLLIANGRLASESTWSEVAANLDDQPQEIVVACDRPRDLAALAMQHPAVISVRVGEGSAADEECTVATRDPGVVCDELARWVDEHGIQIHRFQVVEKWSEALFGMAEGG